MAELDLRNPLSLFEEISKPASNYYGDIPSLMARIPAAKLQDFIDQCVKGPYEDDFVTHCRKFKEALHALKHAIVQSPERAQPTDLKQQYVEQLSLAMLATVQHRQHFKTTSPNFTLAPGQHLPFPVGKYINEQEVVRIITGVVKQLQTIASLGDKILKKHADLMIAWEDVPADMATISGTVNPQDTQLAK